MRYLPFLLLALVVGCEAPAGGWQFSQLTWESGDCSPLVRSLAPTRLPGLPVVMEDVPNPMGTDGAFTLGTASGSVLCENDVVETTAYTCEPLVLLEEDGADLVDEGTFDAHLTVTASYAVMFGTDYDPESEPAAVHLDLFADCDGADCGDLEGTGLTSCTSSGDQWATWEVEE